MLNFVFGGTFLYKKIEYFNQNDKNDEYVAPKKTDYPNGIMNDKFYFQKIERYEKFLNSNIFSNKTIFLGNSLISGFDLSRFGDTSDFINRGIGGDRTIDLINRLDEVIKRNPKKIFIEIGINDIYCDTSVYHAFVNYKALLTEVKRDIPGCKVYIFSLLPTRDIVINDRAIRLNNKLKVLAKNFNFVFIDIYYHFLNNDKRILKSEFAIDNVHLNVTGYKRWESLIRPYIFK